MNENIDFNNIDFNNINFNNINLYNLHIDKKVQIFNRMVFFDTEATKIIEGFLNIRPFVKYAILNSIKEKDIIEYLKTKGYIITKETKL